MHRPNGIHPRTTWAERAWLVPVLVVLALHVPAKACAQAVTGQAVDADDGSALSAAEVTLLDDDGSPIRTVVTDSTGHFGLPLSTAGSYTIRIEHLGYRGATSRTFQVGEGEVLRLELRLGRDAIELEPLVVRARDKAVATHAPEYFERSGRNLRLGRGRILTRGDLEPLGDRTVREALEAKMLHFTNHGYPCEPDIYWNGLAVPSWEIPVTDVEGIEVYRGVSEVPQQYQKDPNATDCGVVLVWSVIHRAGPVKPGSPASDGSGATSGAEGPTERGRKVEDRSINRGVIAAVGAFVLLLALSP